jgi:hypothetical protein
MNSMKKLTSLAMVAVFGMWGCSSNQYTSRSGASYDDLYGSSSDMQVAVRSNTTQQTDRYANPDYQEANPTTQNGQNADYYDESYMSSRNIPRQLSDDVGYNSGFRNGFVAGQNSAFFPGFGNFGSFWPMGGAGFNMGFQMGLRQSLRFGYSPFNYGMGFSPFGFSPFGFDSFGFSPFGYAGFDPFGYSPFGFGSMAYGFGGFGYSPFGLGGFGYSPFGFGGRGFGGFNPYYGGFGNQLIVVNNNYDQGRATRSFGPRSATARSNETYNGDFNNTVRSSRNSGGREAYNAPQSGYTTRGGATTSDSYYARPRANSSGTYYNGNGTSAGRTSGESSYSGRSARTGTSEYYSTPRSSTNSSYSTGNTNRSSRTYNSGSSYNQSRGTNSTYQAPRQSTYQNNSRTMSTPTYNSNSSRGSSTMSAPSSSPSSSGSSAPRSRGPR